MTASRGMDPSWDPSCIHPGSTCNVIVYAYGKTPRPDLLPFFPPPASLLLLLLGWIRHCVEIRDGSSCIFIAAYNAERHPEYYIARVTESFGRYGVVSAILCVNQNLIILFLNFIGFCKSVFIPVFSIDYGSDELIISLPSLSSGPWR